MKVHLTAKQPYEILDEVQPFDLGEHAQQKRGYRLLSRQLELGRSWPGGGYQISLSSQPFDRPPKALNKMI